MNEKEILFKIQEFIEEKRLVFLDEFNQSRRSSNPIENFHWASMLTLLDDIHKLIKPND